MDCDSGNMTAQRTAHSALPALWHIGLIEVAALAYGGSHAHTPHPPTCDLLHVCGGMSCAIGELSPAHVAKALAFMVG